MSQTELERVFLLSWSLVREDRMDGISVAAWLNSSPSKLLGTLHRDSYSDAEA